MFDFLRSRFIVFVLIALAAMMLLIVSCPQLVPLYLKADTEGERASSIEKQESLRSEFERARASFDAGRYEEAIVLLKEILSHDEGNHDAQVLLGWSHYRKGDFRSAEEVFERAQGKFQASTDVMNGLAYARYQLGKRDESKVIFLKILEGTPDDFDALKGLGIIKKAAGDLKEARSLLERALSINPDDGELRTLLEQVASLIDSKEDRRVKGPLPDDVPMRIDAKTVKDYLAVRRGGTWKEVFIKGVNIGAALPGKFPAEFPEEKDLYRKWLDSISEMNANAVRIYTLLPPVFYEALKEHNEEKKEKQLWLIQGVWVELPEADDFYDEKFMSSFKADIERVIDAVHGNIEISFRAGHAHGKYEADVSEYLLAMILGREWEPFSVIRFNRFYPDVKEYKGDYFRVVQGNPMECWIAEICNFTAGYESNMYKTQHPLAFSSWPTLDPIEHPTETSKIEENEIKKRLGMQVHPVKGDQYDDDAVSVDAMRIVPTEKMEAGFFASYHIYPYHPDFLNNDPGYSQTKDAHGANNYLGYLRDLKAYHKDLPLLVAEFGVPTSRGIAHFQPQGFNHGGHTEIEQGMICRRLLKNIVDTKCAGAIVFSWIDEWFKKNWITVDFENPLARNPLWYNAMDPEQSFGLLAMKPGKNGWKITIDGKPDDWNSIPPLYIDGSASVRRRSHDGFDDARDLQRFSVTSDEGYLYMRIDVASFDCDRDGSADWEKSNFLIGIDTYRRDLGDFRFPPPAEVFTPGGMEFMIELKGKSNSRILIDEPYSTFKHTAEGWGPYCSLPNKNGGFVEIKAETNRERYGRDGMVFSGISYSKSPLRFGSMEKGSSSYDSLADWYLDLKEHFIEIRIPWALLNVTDPSSKRVLHQEKSHIAPLDTVMTDGFSFYIVSIDPSVKEGDAAADALPSVYDMGRKGLRAVPLYSWTEWEVPTYHSSLKDSYSILRDDFLAITTYIMKGLQVSRGKGDEMSRAH